MANIDIQLSQLPTLTGLVGSDLVHVKRGIIDYKVTFSEFLKTHTQNLNNPHSVTKTQVGLGNVQDALQLVASDNLSDLTSVGSARTNLQVFSKTEVNNLINSHTNDKNNPHDVTKVQIGLGNVSNVLQLAKNNNLADLDNANTARINLDVYSRTEVVSQIATQHGDLKNNPHSVTKAQIGLSLVANFGYSTNYLENDSNKYATISAVYNAYQNATNDSSNALTNHINDKGNPHGVTKNQIGLGSVNNATWSSSYGSNSSSTYATSKAVYDGVISAKNEATSNLNTFKALRNNPHNVTKSQVGLGSVQNATWSDSTTQVSGTRYYATNFAVGNALVQAKSHSTTLVSNHTALTNNPHSVTKSQVGLGSVNNATWSSTWNNNSTGVYATTRAVYTAYQQAVNVAASSLNSHTGNKSNPHSVTKAQVGLSLVNNQTWSDSYTTSTRYYATTLGLKNGLANAISQAKAYSDSKDPAGWVKVLDVNGADVNRSISSANMLGKEIYIVCTDTSNEDEISTAFALVPRKSGFNSDCDFYIAVGANDYFYWNYSSGVCQVKGDLEIRQVWTRDRSFFPDCGTLTP